MFELPLPPFAVKCYVIRRKIMNNKQFDRYKLTKFLILTVRLQKSVLSSVCLEYEHEKPDYIDTKAKRRQLKNLTSKGT